MALKLIENYVPYSPGAHHDLVKERMTQLAKDVREECAQLLETEAWNDAEQMVNQKDQAFRSASFIRTQCKIE